jgi:hypothetical protein
MLSDSEVLRSLPPSRCGTATPSGLAARSGAQRVRCSTRSRTHAVHHESHTLKPKTFMFKTQKPSTRGCACRHGAERPDDMTTCTTQGSLLNDKFNNHFRCTDITQQKIFAVTAFYDVIILRYCEAPLYLSTATKVFV